MSKSDRNYKPRNPRISKNLKKKKHEREAETISRHIKIKMLKTIKRNS